MCYSVIWILFPVCVCYDEARAYVSLLSKKVVNSPNMACACQWGMQIYPHLYGYHHRFISCIFILASNRWSHHQCLTQLSVRHAHPQRIDGDKDGHFLKTDVWNWDEEWYPHQLYDTTGVGLTEGKNGFLKQQLNGLSTRGIFHGSKMALSDVIEYFNES